MRVVALTAVLLIKCVVCANPITGKDEYNEVKPRPFEVDLVRPETSSILPKRFTIAHPESIDIDSNVLLESSVRFRRQERSTIDCRNLYPGGNLYPDNVSDSEIIDYCVNASFIYSHLSSKCIDLSKVNVSSFNSFFESKAFIYIPLVLRKGPQIQILKSDKLFKFTGITVDTIANLTSIDFEYEGESGQMWISNNERLEIVSISFKRMSTLSLINNSNLTKIRLDSLNWISKFIAINNPKLKEINFPQCNHSNTLTIQNNAALKRMSFPELVKCEYVTVTDNIELEEVNFVKVKHIIGRLFVKNNPVLKETLFPEIGSLSGFFDFSQNNKLEKIQLGTAEKTNDFIIRVLTINRNPSLSKVTILKTLGNTKHEFPYINIYGNRNLKRSEIDFQCPENGKYCYIQDDYECIFDQPIANLSELDGCSNIYGDLILDESLNTETTTETKIFKIEGNLTIANLSLIKGNLGFLENAVVIGDLDVTTCGSRIIYPSLNLTVKGQVSFSPGASCVGVCTAEDLVISKREDCEIVKGFIQMRWEPYTAADVENFKMVKQLIGRIDLENVFPEGNLSDPLEFTNLETIETPEGGISIRLNSNQYMNRLPFPKLTAVNTPNKYMAEISYNGFEFPMKKLFEWEANMTKSIITEEEMFPYLPGPQLVTKLIEIDEDELHFDEYDQNLASSFAVLPPILLLIIRMM